MNRISSRRIHPRVPGFPPFHVVALAVLVIAAASCERQGDNVTDATFSPSVSLEGSLARTSLNLDSTSLYVLRNADGSYTVTDTVVAVIRPAALASTVRQITYTLTRQRDIVASGMLARSASLSDSAHAVFASAFTLQLLRSDAGRYMLELSASRSDGGPSPSVSLPLIIAKANSAPVPGAPNVRQLTSAAAESVKFVTSIAVADSDGLADIVRVGALIHGTEDSSTVLSLRDDGSPSSGDLVEGDGIFTASVWIRPTVSLAQVVFEFNAEDAAHNLSPSVFRSLQNHRPLILTLGVPDSIQRPASGSTLIPFYLAAADSDGLGDIDSVYFFNASSATPTIIGMYDDGNVSVTGDTMAGDGVFSRIVQITSSNTTGLKEFHFDIVDRTGARDEIIKNILVY